jgi:hypothetical protein
VKRTALLREEGGRTVSDPAEIDEEIHAFATPRLHPEGGLAHENRGQTHLPELLVMSFLKRLLHSLTVTFVAAVVVLAANKRLAVEEIVVVHRTVGQAVEKRRAGERRGGGLRS